VQVGLDVSERATPRLRDVAPDEQHADRAHRGEDPERRALSDRVGERHEQQLDDEAREPVDSDRDAGPAPRASAVKISAISSQKIGPRPTAKVDRLATGLRGAWRRRRGRKPSGTICWRLEA
jgi:hypothetical protein